MLTRLVEHALSVNLTRSVETGTGKSTLLFSHLSAHHTVFAKDDTSNGDSLRLVQDSPILRSSAVEFVVGPTQKTVPQYEFANHIQLAFIDGPHGYPFPDLEYYFIYPHITTNGLLIVDDINIPTVFNLVQFLKEDKMFEMIEVVRTTAFFRRTATEVFDPFGDGWWLQEYNRKGFPVADTMIKYSTTDRMKALLPRSLKRVLKKIAGRA